MIPLFLVPLPRGASLPGYAPAEEGLAVKAEAWVRAKGAGVLGVWKDSKEGSAVDGVDATKFTHEFELLDSLLRVLTHRRFNFQSQKNIHPDLIPQARERLQMQLQEGKPLAFYLSMFVARSGFSVRMAQRRVTKNKGCDRPFCWHWISRCHSCMQNVRLDRNPSGLIKLRNVHWPPKLLLDFLCKHLLGLGFAVNKINRFRRVRNRAHPRQ